MDYIIRKVEFDEIEVALTMAMKVFMEFEAPDYSEEGIETFRKKIIENPEFKNRFKTGEQQMLGAFINDKIIGLIAISIRNHISLLFVDKSYHRKGVATALFKELLKRVKGDKITLNSSPYGVYFYHKIGFVDTDVQQKLHGIIYTPMEIKI